MSGFVEGKADSHCAGSILTCRFSDIAKASLSWS